MTARDDHVHAVGFAGLEIEALRNSVAALTARFEEVIGAVYNATGENVRHVESARNAFENMAAGRDKLDEILGHLTVALSEITRYGAGF